MRALAVGTTLVLGLLWGAGCTRGPGGARLVAGAKEAAPSCARDMAWLPRSWERAPVRYVSAAAAPGGDGSAERPFADLQQAIDAAPDGALLRLGEGELRARPRPYVDPCGNCEPTPPKLAQATQGFVVRGKSLALVGAGASRTTLLTGAGYGVFVEDACEVLLADLSVSGGVRDEDPSASDAAVFVRKARAVLERVELRDNDWPQAVKRYPGVAGVLCREDSDVLITGSRIVRNSWDAVAVYRDGRLRLFGSTLSVGNGVALGVTWNGRAVAVNNDLSQYWKGIGSFAEAQVEARNNVIHHHKAWGIAASGKARFVGVNNTIAYNDQLGVLFADPETTGELTNNVVAYNGLDRVKAYKPDVFGQGGVRSDGAGAHATTFRFNDVYGNGGADWLASDGEAKVPRVSWGESALNVEPGFISEENLSLSPASPLRGAGAPELRNPDGGRSDVGYTGGPDAERVTPGKSRPGASGAASG